MRAEEEGAEEHYLKQKWRQNPPVRSILLPPPPPPAPLPHRGRREPSGVPATRGSRHRASPAQVGKRPFFTKKKIKEAERKLPQLFLLAESRRGARPKSLGGENSTHKGLPRAGRRGGGAARRGGGEGAGQSLRPHLGPKSPVPASPPVQARGRATRVAPALGRETEETNADSSALPCAGNPPGAGWKEELGCWAAGSRGKGALGSAVRGASPLPAASPDTRPRDTGSHPTIFCARPSAAPERGSGLDPIPLARPPERPGPARPHTHPTHTMPESSILPAAPARLGRRGEEEEEKAVLHFSSPRAGPGLPAAGFGEEEGGRGGQGGRFRRPLSHSHSARLPPPRRGAPGTGGGEAGGWSVFAARPRRPPSWLRAVPAASRPGAPRGPGRRGPRPGLSSPPRTTIPCPPAKLPEASPPFSNLPCPVSA